MMRRKMTSDLPVDRDVAALIVKVGNYPLHHGGVGAIRSLGRLGVPVYAVSEDRWTPAALSRYCRDCFVWPSGERADPKRMVERLQEAGREIAGPAVLVPTDEEAAVLIAENSAALAEWFLLPRVPSHLPARLASKRGLYELCLEHDVPAPASSFPQTAADVGNFAATATFPVVAKNLEAWVRLHAPVVNGTTVIGTAAELLALARQWGAEPSVILQEYIPPEHAEDWIVHLYRGAGGDPLVLFTGVKVRSWPPQAGMTACAYTASNQKLAALAARLCERVGYCGIADLDFRYDRRDGRYKLVDFNPRVGAQFRLFENAAGVDVVRALHLDLTGRPVSLAPPSTDRRIIVENVDLTARLARQRNTYHAHVPAHPVRTELAWFAADDPLPVAAMLARSAGPLATYLRRVRRTRELRRAAETVSPPSAEPAALLPEVTTVRDKS
jgi:predicted ATP-grasp superfamily ATP-dependent carboligase